MVPIRNTNKERMLAKNRRIHRLRLVSRGEPVYHGPPDEFMVARGLLIILLLLVSVASAAAQTLHVSPLPRDEQIYVTFRLEQALTDEIRAVIHSGMTVSFVYKVDLRRGSSVWFDRTLASTEVRASIRYDNLTRRYTLSRMMDGRMGMGGVETTDSEEVAWKWLTADFERLPLFRSLTLESNAEYYVRVRAHTAPRNASFVWPWQGDDVVGLMKFTLIR